MKNEIKLFFDAIDDQTSSGEFVAHWLSKKGSMPHLSKYALALATVPASSSGIERVFSVAKICTRGVSNRTGAALLEAQLIVGSF